MTNLVISDWRMIDVTLEGLGPFQNGPETFDFMGDTPSSEAEGTDPGPSNFYMLLARNGRGKTTVLETIHGLFGLLSNPPSGRFENWQAPGRAQVDIRATWTIDGDTRTVLLSIWTGSPEPMMTWEGDRLEDKAQATAWARLGIVRHGGGITLSDATDELGKILFNAIRDQAGMAPGSLFGNTLGLPTVLFFPADRMLKTPAERRVVEAPDNWMYQPAHEFGVDGETWNGSIDNLLVWLAWIGEGELEELLKFVNTRLFAEDMKVLRAPRRQELATYVSTPAGDHPLGGLSHGERALLQLYLRSVAHMTQNTVILIDEVEIHLHTKWMNRMFQALKAMLAEMPALSVIFTTHDRELIAVFDHKRSEPGLVKGGFLIAEDMA